MTEIDARSAQAAGRITKTSRRATLSGAVGNLLEQYDSVIYAFSATTVAGLFFPSSSGTVGLLLTFAVFAVGFGARPIGALIFGYVGDRFGRRAALIWSVVLMATCTTAIGLLPTHATIGVAAPVLLTLIRILQGISTAGETAGSATFIVEHAPTGRRGFLGSFQQVTSGAGFLLASVVTLVMGTVFGPDQISSWAWRLPFLLGLLTGLVALWLRFGVPESPKFVEQSDSTTRHNPLATMARTSMPQVLRATAFVGIWSIGYYLFLTYIPTYLQKVVGVPASEARASNLIGLVTFVVFIPLFGRLSDRVGRKPVMLTSCGLFAFGSIPVLWALSTGNTTAVYILQVVVAVMLAAIAGAGPAALAEMFPTNVRFSSMSLGWNVSNTLFGGTAPFIATFLISSTGVSWSPALLPVVCAVLAFVVVATGRETAHNDLL